MDYFNEKRKILLMKMDAKEYVDNLSLGMYELTPYYKETFDSSLAEKILFYQNDQREVMHIKKTKVCFAPPQNNALIFLEENDRCILSAPTSFGKTLIVKEYIYRHKPKNVIFIVPTNALAYELESSFKSNDLFSFYTVFDRNKSDINEDITEDYKLFIGTQEKYLEIKNVFDADIDLFVIDEAYKLEDKTSNQRGYKLSETFLDSVLDKTKKLFLLSPNAEFEGFEKYNFKTHNSMYNPVEKFYQVISEEGFYDELSIQSTMNKTILYCDSPKIINESVDRLSFQNKEIISDEFIQYLEQEFHPEWSVVKLLKKGILVHHGQMPKYIQNKMIYMFNNIKGINLLIGTKSISEGINTPTKNVFIHPENTKIQNDKLLLKNTIGRAGRLGEYPIGYIYSVYDLKSIVDETIKIKLSISKEDELKEIEESNDESVIDCLCSDYNISKEFYSKIRKMTKLSLRKIAKVLTVLKNGCQYSNISSLPFVACTVFNEYTSANIDKLCIRGVLQDYYFDKDRNKHQLNNLRDKIAFFKEKSNSDSEDESTIIDHYMKFIYASLEYYILPIVKICNELTKDFSDWTFGPNILEAVNDFNKRYTNKFFDIPNYENFTEEQKTILQTLKEYGIATNASIINHEMIIEIESTLKIRYSTYDILKAIEFLSINSVNNKLKFYEIKRKYLI